MLPKDLAAVANPSARLVSLKGDFTDRSPSSSDALAPAIMLDLVTLELLEVEVTSQDLLAGFQNIMSDSNRLAILHYFLVHVGDLGMVEEVRDLFLRFFD